MDYQKLKLEIEEEIIKLAELIEQFCVIDNKEYMQLYKNKLNDLHLLLEEILK
jgi:hypothetical protein